MSEAEPYRCAECGEEHTDPAECPEFDLAGEDEDDHPSGREIRENAIEELSDAHIAAMVIITFPRDDNDHDEVDYGTTSFALGEDCSTTELIAGKKLATDGIDILADIYDESPPSATVAAVPTDGLAQMLGGRVGGEPDEDDEGGHRPAGFQ